MTREVKPARLRLDILGVIAVGAIVANLIALELAILFAIAGGT